jgi:hypothetical protein
MHLLLPFAAAVSEGGQHALRSLALPHAAAWLRGAREVERDDGDEFSLTPPHERARGSALGWRAADGLWPFAAHRARADGIDAAAAGGWALLTPVHWHLGTEQLSLADPATLMLDEHSARGLFDALAPLFTSEGFGIHWGRAGRWYLSGHESLATLPTASIDRVIGRNVDRWLIDGRAGRLLRRLQNEVQMLLHAHPTNAEREARGLLAVNSVWISGTGAALPDRAGGGAEVVVDQRLRTPALAEDWAGWCKAWDSLDAAWPAGLSRLTLCGERASATFEPVRGVMNTLRGLAAPTRLLAVLERL